MPFLILLSVANVAIMTGNGTDEKITIWASFADPMLYPFIGIATAAYLLVLRYRSGLTRRQNFNFCLMVVMGILSSWAVYFVGITSSMIQILVFEEDWQTLVKPLLAGDLDPLISSLKVDFESWVKFMIGSGIIGYYMRTIANDSANARAGKDLLEKVMIFGYRILTKHVFKSTKSFEQFDISYTNKLRSMKFRILLQAQY